jgi:hypothetical protein
LAWRDPPAGTLFAGSAVLFAHTSMFAAGSNHNNQYQPSFEAIPPRIGRYQSTFILRRYGTSF